MEISIKEITHFLNLVRQKELISKNEQVAYPFNLILSSSDFYYRENFHSDIICSIFNQKPLFVKEFIVFIQSCKTSLNIDLSNYNKPYALRETDKIDILIKDKKSNHCIIIENKINDANDMKRQLPRYYTTVQDKGYCVDAIVYLSLDGRKEINRSSWEDQDYKKIDTLIVKIAASAINDLSFCTVFLRKITENNTCTIQEYTFIRQYIDLLQFLGGSEMNNEIMEKFYNELQNEENYNAAKAIVEGMKQLTDYRLKKYKKKFENNHDPFDHIEIWKQGKGLIFRNCREYTDYEIKFEIYPEQKKDKTIIIFKVQEEEAETGFIKHILERTKLSSIFHEEYDNWFEASFDFPKEEDKMIEDITEFLENFNAIVKCK